MTSEPANAEPANADLLVPGAVDEESLIELAKTDPAALAALYRRYYTVIYGYVQRRIGHAHDAQDVVAEVFLTMVRYLPRYQWTGAPFQAWLLRLATTQIQRWARKRKWTRWWSRLEDAPSLAAGTATAGDAKAEQLRQALWKLPSRFQAVLALHYLEGQSLEAISEVLNCPVGTVKSRLARGRDGLRAQLAKNPSNPNNETSPHERRTIELVPQRVEG